TDLSHTEQNRVKLRSPNEGMGCMGRSTQLRAQALDRCRHKGGRKAGRQLAASDCFDRPKHVGGAAAGKKADPKVPFDPNPRLRELVRSSCSGDLLTLDEYTVAIKDDHGSLAPARSLRGRAARLLFHESPLNNKNRGRGKSRAPCGSGIFLHSFLLRTLTVAGKRPLFYFALMSAMAFVRRSSAAFSLSVRGRIA